MGGWCVSQPAPQRFTDGCLLCCHINRLFETHPECKDVFFLFRDVKDLEKLRSSRELRAHGLRSVGPRTRLYGYKRRRRFNLKIGG